MGGNCCDYCWSGRRCEKKSPAACVVPSVSGWDGAANGLFTESNTRKFMVHVTPGITGKVTTPEYIHQVLCKALASGVTHRYPTTTAGTRVVAEASLAVANSSFRWRASTQYAALPMELKSEENMQSFLNRLKTHTIETIDIWNLKEKFKSSSWDKSDTVCIFMYSYVLYTWGNKLLLLLSPLFQCPGPGLSIPILVQGNHTYILFFT